MQTSVPRTPWEFSSILRQEAIRVRDPLTGVEKIRQVPVLNFWRKVNWDCDRNEVRAAGVAAVSDALFSAVAA